MIKSKRAFLTAIVTLLVAYAVVCLVAYLLQGKLIYHPIRGRAANPISQGLEFTEYTLSGADSTTFVVWKIHQPLSRTAVVVFHGNAENISNCSDLYQTWNQLGAEVIAFEYRGYLNSIGTPSEQAIDQDLAVLADSIRTWYGGTETKVIAMGRSLGGAVAAKFASIYPVDGLILESTFSSMADMGHHQFPFLPAKLLLKERFDSESIVSKLKIPILVIHSPDDGVVPFHLGRKLYNAAAEPKEFVSVKGGHNSYVSESSQLLIAAYREFLTRISRTI